MDHNGSVRTIVQAMDPISYVGVDLERGPGVDRVCDAMDLIETFGRNSFDVVVSTEVVEHVFDWRTVMSNLKGVLAPGGVLVITTRSLGYPYHAAPSDWWRYELADMERVFADMEVTKLEADPLMPGVFVSARKGAPWIEADLSDITLYSMIAHRRIHHHSRVDLAKHRVSWFYRTNRSVALAKQVIPRSVRIWVSRHIPALKTHG